MRDYFPRTEFQRAGLSEVAIRALEKIADFVQTQQELAQAQTDIADQGDSITALALADAALDARLDGLEGETLAKKRFLYG